MQLKYWVPVLCMALAISCKSQEAVVEKSGQAETGRSGLEMMIDTSRVFSGNFTGFQLYDPEADSTLYGQYTDKYFTPASNTKLFTFYTGLKLLPDSLPGIQYIVQGDSLIFWGTGDPSFLHPDFGTDKVYNFLNNSPHKLYYSDAHFEDELLGPGWAWSDYNYYYSAEKSPFPVYGNVVRFTMQRIRLQKIKSTPDGLEMSPPFFQKQMQRPDEYEKDESLQLYRGFEDNIFTYSPESDTVTYTVDKPFHYQPELIADILADTLKKPVKYIRVNRPDAVRTLYSISADTAYKRMLQPSDNFIAEQLLLAAAAELNLPLNSREVIQYMKEHYLNDLSDEPQWVDGSGLSRYNMFTPRSMVELLKKIRAEFPSDEKLFQLLAIGGREGTIRNWYKSRDGAEAEPYVFAKTGTLSNNHTLSGYIKTRSGRTLIFSFMNNHYITPSSVVKHEMEKVLWHIHANY